MNIIRYYTDSMVVLGYLNNRSRRFYNYVSNRVSAILRRSNSGQLHFVPTGENPADLGTRCGTTPLKLMKSDWFSGPPQLMTLEPYSREEYPLIDAATDKELRPDVITRKTLVQENVEHISSERFAHFLSWSRLVGAVSWLKCRLSARVSGKGVVNPKSPEALKAEEEFVIRTVQREAFLLKSLRLEMDVLCLRTVPFVRWILILTRRDCFEKLM